MDTMSRFRRRVRPKPPPIQTTPVERSSSDSGTSEGGAALGPPVPVSLASKTASPASNPSSPAPTSGKSDRLAPFRNFRLRSSSAKRARSRTPNGVGSPLTGSNAPPNKMLASSHLQDERPKTAPSTRTVNSPAPNGRNGHKPQMPTFLTCSSRDIDNKFQDLTWAERDRVAEGIRHQNIPNFKWGHYNQPTFPKDGVMDRYNNIKPWNHNRVHLKVPEDKLDYVNASTITVKPVKNGSNNPLRFIAMQGPTEPSFPYVWRMMAEQTTSPAVIVQLTTMSEGGGVKCGQYFPLDGPGPRATWILNKEDVWGDGWYAQLVNEKVERIEGGAIEKRKFVLRMLKRKPKPVKDESDDDSDEGTDLNEDDDEGSTESDETEEESDEPEEPEFTDDDPLVIHHFLYKRWPDFGVPTAEDLPSFLKLMKITRECSATDSPRIVHCSAGVGRTGTFISLEHLMRELEAGTLEGWDDKPETHSFRGRVGVKDRTPDRDLIYETVDTLRRQRKLMVQGEAQYRFLYQVMRRLWVEKYGGIGGLDSLTDDEDEGLKPMENEDTVSDLDADGADGPDIGGGVAIGDIR